MATKNKDFSIDYNGMLTKLAMNKTTYRLADVKDRIEVLAFDIVRFRDGDKGAELWQVQSADDGDYIVALYDEEAEAAQTKTASAKNPANWGVLITKQGSLQISYKGDPLLKMSAEQLGIPPQELSQAERYLPEKLASNKKLVQALLKELSQTARQETIRRYPELV